MYNINIIIILKQKVALESHRGREDDQIFLFTLHLAPESTVLQKNKIRIKNIKIGNSENRYIRIKNILNQFLISHLDIKY